jgi:hypothetical protein
MRNGILIFKFNFFPNVVMVHLRQAAGSRYLSQALFRIYLAIGYCQV